MIRIMGEKYFDVNDLVDLLPLGRQSICKSIKRGELPGVKIKKLWLVKEMILKRYLEGEKFPKETK